MADKLKEIWAKIQGWWNRFTARQKTIIIAIAAVVIFAFAILIYAISRPQYTRLGTYANTAESSEVVSILDDAGITHRESDDALTIEVVTDQLYQANLALGSAGIVSDMLKYGDFVNSSMSTTTSDRENQWQLYLQEQLRRTLKAQESVKEAWVVLTIPPQNGTLAASQEEASAWITLELDGNLSSSQAAGLARCVAASLGNATTANITIIDQESNLLFAGETTIRLPDWQTLCRSCRTRRRRWWPISSKKCFTGQSSLTALRYPVIWSLIFPNTRRL